MAIHRADELSYELYNERNVRIYEWDDDNGYISGMMNSSINDMPDIYFIYHIFTVEEKASHEQIKADKAKQELVNSSPERIDDVEDVLASSDEALCELYEDLVGTQDTVQQQDDAICELYELIVGGEVE